MIALPDELDLFSEFDDGFGALGDARSDASDRALTPEPEADADVHADECADARCDEAAAQSPALVTTPQKPYEARYFIIKSFSHENIAKSLETSIWCTNARNDGKMHDSFALTDVVYLIFSVNGSGGFQGYATMRTGVEGMRVEWESGKASGGAFGVQWERLCDVPFARTAHLRNPWNENQPVKVARDTQEIEPTVGAALVALMNAAADTAGSAPLPRVSDAFLANALQKTHEAEAERARVRARERERTLALKAPPTKQDIEELERLIREECAPKKRKRAHNDDELRSMQRAQWGAQQWWGAQQHWAGQDQWGYAPQWGYGMQQPFMHGMQQPFMHGNCALGYF